MSENSPTLFALTCLFAAVVGFVAAWFLTRAPELSSMRLSQFVLVPCLSAACAFSAKDAPFCFPFLITALAIVLAPVIAYHGGVQLSNFLDRQDWTPLEEEIALRPIRVLVDRDNFRQALGELDVLLLAHNPTYEAVLLKAKLLNHIGRVDEAHKALVDLINLSNSPDQQRAAMEWVSSLERSNATLPRPPAPGTRTVVTDHDLLLFPVTEDESPSSREIAPGTYIVEEMVHRERLWLKLAGENFGNAEIYWDAVLASNRPAPEPPKSGILWRIARMNQAISIAIKGKPRRQLMAESRDFFAEAKKFIHNDDWISAKPLLQKASACDPDRFEIAYRWLMAVRQTSDDAATATVLTQVLEQSQWTHHEREMLQQLKRPLPK